ncbi:DNA-3-methyladenine glycosylase [Nocardioides sp. SYSU D00038]|uniref:DNA-3-methyladenine glycosylase n=1 Tax=Nocardioides sp. SYSU D00038 TaxID=2812554 RepID=UPI0027DDCB05|nr:DNA-3-methyladenine glycosylase [Nocardioides sp. SYSU D00038]
MPAPGDRLAALLAGPVLEVAPRLLGAVLRHGDVAVRLTEVEAYAGPDDPGSHAYRGETRRNRVMFGPSGRLYCYFTYGMHVCANVVTGAEGDPSAVLLRAGEVVDGLAIARAHRPGVNRDWALARGPANLVRTLGITLEHDGADLSGPELVLLAPDAAAGGTAAAEVRTGPRVGLRGAPDRPWRFWLAGEPSVSAYRPAAPRRSRPAT